jgi:galactose oxidase
VKLAFHRTGKNRLSIRTPSDLGAAPPGYYMLFVLDEDGVPSVAKEIRLGSDHECD